MSTDIPSPKSAFDIFTLSAPLQKAINESGYKSPTPIQMEMIPHMLEGRDVVGQAQTGTGKTAAFALPLLQQLKAGKSKSPQILVLAPTRELAIQVADSFSAYGKHIKKLQVLPVFGGQDYTVQLRQLHKGVDIVVGTPGRIMDHIRRGSLKTEAIHSLVLDEADEMLRMGFLDDVEWILEQLPGRKQTALFSATMPANIRKIAQKYLKNPVEITIKTKAVTAQTVSQRYLVASGFVKKIEALSRLLETENTDGILVFVRTKLQTVELAEKLAALGYSAIALNGDIQQSQRLRSVEQLKSGKIDILVATDVAARGLDVDRISHVINFDIPFDTEAYIHRIGRTGRAGRSGEAILLLNPRERSMLRSIERATKQKIRSMELPTVADINKKRVENFKLQISLALQGDTSFYEGLVADYLHDNQVAPEKVAAALAQLVHGKKTLLEPEPQIRKSTYTETRRPETARKKSQGVRKMAVQLPPDEGMERFQLAVGNSHGVKPSNIVGAIANEADISSKHIGRISIYDAYSTVDLPYGMPDDVLNLLQRVRVGGRMLRIQRTGDSITKVGKSRFDNGKGKKKNSDSRRRVQQKKHHSTPAV
ncbi:MAG: DEAD/DEAH box helicase [Desulforhopalus sp.]